MKAASSVRKLRTVLNTDNEDVSGEIEIACVGTDVPPYVLLALCKAESGLNFRAERYGVWPDISFGPTQQTVAYAPWGDRTNTPANIEYVHQYILNHTDEILKYTVGQLSDNKPRSLDNSWLGAMTVYNAGSDRRNDPTWMAKWSANVVRYQQALAWALTYAILE